MNIGVICYASVGGSGVVATELGQGARGAGTPRPPDQHGHAVPARRVPGGPLVPPGADAELPAVPGAAVPAVARQQGRPGRARVPARHHPRALRDSARDGGAAGAAGARGERPHAASRASSRRCTARTSPSSATIRRTRRSWRSRSSSPTAPPRCRESLREATRTRARASSATSRSSRTSSTARVFRRTDAPELRRRFSRDETPRRS